jgi:poly(hydroxyalkanoate) granule-associated protein
MARKQVKTRKIAAPPMDGARSLWLAGLGAVALTRREGDRLYTRLSAESRSLRQRSEKALGGARKKVEARVGRAVKPLQRRFDRQAAKIGTRLERGIGRGLARLGVPSKSEVEELTQRVASLSRQVRAAAR